ncbi:uncharacterized protein LOC120679843 isoform X3 [Panicum virgatum]|uniref:Uncharacterized protein n=1 Tax=Panicum virgatum TaxID=38727 RepID=A0A8T0QZM8_PANVG|nr:uncharacterized protein LOC120679843 isoform X3 [Panicum virgatum]KAG2578498.1 hypothetical protein PVAP13_6NG212500 [Panicum virgatum]KAG2578500.1 hypothetical protein PVAP13_6NG212500 [Panicum virgatum]
MRMPRLEFQAPPDVFYNESDACKYTTSSRIIGIQDFEEEAAAARPPQQCVPKLLLDIGYTPAKNDFLFETRLQSFIYDVLMQHSRGKCALVFCTTRKGRCTFVSTRGGPIIPSLTFVSTRGGIEILKVEDGIVHNQPKLPGLPRSLAFSEKDLCKYFNPGDHVKVVSRVQEGTTGMDVRLEGSACLQIMLWRVLRSP